MLINKNNKNKISIEYINNIENEIKNIEKNYSKEEINNNIHLQIKLNMNKNILKDYNDGKDIAIYENNII